MVKKLFGWLLRIVVTAFAASILVVVAYKFLPPPVTPLMLQRLVEGVFAGKPVGITKNWVSYDEISPNFFRAVIASEDGRFLEHGGIDWQAVDEARNRNERNAARAAKRVGKSRPPKIYGASTITMQTAKNAFLPPARNYVRKAFEVYFTYLIEFVWGKKRILEVYANIIEMGNGVYGVEAASEAYFGKSASKLSQYEAAMLAAILPDPRRRSPTKPSVYLQGRATAIQAQMGGIALPQ